MNHALSLYKEHNEAKKGSNQAKASISSWLSPAVGFVKLNVDGLFSMISVR